MKKRAILLTLLILTLIIFDQLTKWLVITNIKENSITVIQNILNFTYVENKGVAFGINSNGGISNIIISIFVIIMIYGKTKRDDKQIYQYFVSINFSGRIWKFNR